MLITLGNARQLNTPYSVIKRRRVTGSNNIMYYELLEGLDIELSDKDIIHIPKGFIWDLSSVPRHFWGLLPPDGDFELSSLIHDYLYITQIKSRKFADDEMFLWSKVLSGTHNKVSMRNFDNWLRYIVVRLFGWDVWNDRKKNKIIL